MAFTYNTTLSASRDQLRFLISDVDSANVIFQDAELDGVLSLASNVFRAAALSLRARAASFIEKAIQYSIGADVRGQLSVDRREIISNFNLLIASYEARAESPDEAFDRFDFNIDVFGRDRSHYQGRTEPEGSWE